MSFSFPEFSKKSIAFLCLRTAWSNSSSDAEDLDVDFCNNIYVKKKTLYTGEIFLNLSAKNF